MNRLLRGEYSEPEPDKQEQITPESVASQVAGKSDGGAGRDGQPALDVAAGDDFLREAYRTHRGLSS